MIYGSIPHVVNFMFMSHDIEIDFSSEFFTLTISILSTGKDLKHSSIL